MISANIGIIYTFFKEFRKTISTNVIEEQESIGGEGIVVEIDESKFGKENTIDGDELAMLGLLV